MTTYPTNPYATDNTPVHGCSGCSTTGGRMACPHHGPQARSAGTHETMVLNAWQKGSELCALGYHAWVPWLELPSGSHTTWCARPGCDHAEQYDY